MNGLAPALLEDVAGQGRLSLPAESAATVERGQTEWRLGLLWANTFAWTQDVPGETPSDRRFLLDGETLSLDLGLTRGLRPGLDVAARLPLLLRGGGVMDELAGGAEHCERDNRLQQHRCQWLTAQIIARIKLKLQPITHTNF